MKAETQYRYEKKIKELLEENSRLAHYRTVAIRIFDVACNEPFSASIKCSWIAKQFRELLK